MDVHDKKIIRLILFSIDDLGRYLSCQEPRLELARLLEQKAKEYRAPREVIEVKVEVKDGN
jgi:hypothetical protein